MISISKSQIGNHVAAVALGVIAFPMDWLHLYPIQGTSTSLKTGEVSDAPAYGSSIEVYGYDVPLWLPIAFSFLLSLCLVLEGLGIATFPKWLKAVSALVIATTLLLPLWPFFAGSGYLGLGWYVGVGGSSFTLLEYLSEIAAQRPSIN